MSFDLLVSIEGVYEKIDNTYFIVTYASILDKNGNEFIGKSNGLQITERMFNYVKDGNSLNKVIENILNNSNNKKDNGITGYLTNGYYRRDVFESSAVISAMQTLLNFESNYKKLLN
ncbi:MAG: inosine/xanthosine triphosphatase [Tenericutes bacterium]|nr:inosine/xanthosine triphosphatase [Mycoplasmatota bacterium]